jgi:hypothetical protein
VSDILPGQRPLFDSPTFRPGDAVEIDGELAVIRDQDQDHINLRLPGSQHRTVPAPTWALMCASQRVKPRSDR